MKKKIEEGEVSAQEILDRFHVSFQHVKDNDHATAVIESIYQNHSDTVLGLDIETAKLEGFEQNEKAGLDPHLSRIRLIQVCTGLEVFIFDMNVVEMQAMEPLWYLPLVAHNAVFEIKHLLHAGANPLQMDCTMLMANAIGEGRPSLENLALSRFGLKISKTLQTSDWNAPALTNDQLAYAALDAWLACQLYYTMMDDFRSNQHKIYNLMKDAQKSIAKLELNGFSFDVVNHIILMADWEEQKKSAEKNLRKLLGPEININSPKQLADWLTDRLDSQTLQRWPKTGKGQLSTNEDALAQFPDHPLVRPLLKYKEISKLLSTYGAKFADHVNPITGRLHADFQIGGAATGRFTSGSPNSQNIPKDEAFRSLFVAQPERLLIVGDYNQIELRVVAVISKDPILLEAYNQGEDIHKKTASIIAGISMDEVTKKQRQSAKAVNFGLLFGQGARGLARYAKKNFGINMSENEAGKNIKAFFRTYSGLAKWQKNKSSWVKMTMQTTTPSGRIRKFNSEAKSIYTEGLNTPIQGGAAEVLLAALPILDNYLDGLDAKLVNIVHDEIVVEATPEHLGQAMSAVERAMIGGMLSIFPGASTKYLVDLKIGNSWAEAK